jgi:hypothetical protein
MRRTPQPERHPSLQIAAVTRTAQSVIRYDLAIATECAPGLQAIHHAAHSPGPGRRNVEDVLAFYQAAGRLPLSGRSRLASTMADWLTRRRKDAADGPLSPAYATALYTIPRWRDT